MDENEREQILQRRAMAVEKVLRETQLWQARPSPFPAQQLPATIQPSKTQTAPKIARRKSALPSLAQDHVDTTKAKRQDRKKQRAEPEPVPTPAAIGERDTPAAAAERAAPAVEAVFLSPAPPRPPSDPSACAVPPAGASERASAAAPLRQSRPAGGTGGTGGTGGGQHVHAVSDAAFGRGRGGAASARPPTTVTSHTSSNKAKGRSVGMFSRAVISKTEAAKESIAAQRRNPAPSASSCRAADESERRYARGNANQQPFHAYSWLYPGAQNPDAGERAPSVRSIHSPWAAAGGRAERPPHVYSFTAASPPETPLHGSGLRMSWEPEAAGIPSHSFDPPPAWEMPRSPSARPRNSLVDEIVHGEANTQEELSALLASNTRRCGTWEANVPAGLSEQLPRMFTGMSHCRVYSHADLWRISGIGGLGDNEVEEEEDEDDEAYEQQHGNSAWSEPVGSSLPLRFQVPLGVTTFR